jgi:hypothetical protein
MSSKRLPSHLKLHVYCSVTVSKSFQQAEMQQHHPTAVRVFAAAAAAAALIAVVETAAFELIAATMMLHSYAHFTSQPELATELFVLTPAAVASSSAACIQKSCETSRSSSLYCMM